MRAQSDEKGHADNRVILRLGSTRIGLKTCSAINITKLYLSLFDSKLIEM